jgi:hypothetical protein
MFFLAFCVVIYGCGTQRHLNNIPITFRGSTAGREPAASELATRRNVDQRFHLKNALITQTFSRSVPQRVYPVRTTLLVK